MYSHLKVHRDGRPGPFLFIVGGQQLDLCTDLRLLHPSHAFDPANTQTESFVNKVSLTEKVQISTRINKGQVKQALQKRQSACVCNKLNTT